MEGANRYFYVLLATFLVALIGLTQLLVKTYPLLFTHAINLCQKTFSNITITFPVPLSILIIGSITSVFLIGILSIAIQTFKTRWYITKHLSKRIAAGKSLQVLFESLHLENKVDVVKDANLLSFSYGLIYPRICISTGLIQALSPEELKSVLLHESYHIINYDPLKIILSKTASFMFFFLPIMYDFQRNYAFSKELAADQIAIQQYGREDLLSVLSKLLSIPTPRFSGVAALADIGTLEERILYLTDQKKRYFIRLSKKHLVFSFGIALLTVFALNIPTQAIAVTNNSTQESISTFYICPFGDSCTNSCKGDIKSTVTSSGMKESKSMLYSPSK